MTLTLISRSDCHLCLELADELRRRGVAFDTIDVDADATLLARYGDAVPVLLDGDRELGRAPFSARVIKDAVALAGRTAETKR